MPATPGSGRVWDLFHDALERPAGERRAYLAAVCGDDAALLAEAESLLRAHDRADGFLEPTPGRAAPIVPVLLQGRTIGAYRIDSELAAGGMGVVYLAHDVRLGRRVAIKALPPGVDRDPGVLARFQREARLLASLSHPNVATVFGLEHEADGYYLVMEYVEGETLADRLTRGPLPFEDALEVCAQIAAGLEAAHEAGVIHRDLKPANVGLMPDGRVVVLDFGLARHVSADLAVTGDAALTEQGMFIGTPGYMSPEQARSRPIDRRTDVFSFGCVLYACLTGRRAFPGDSPGDAIAALLEREPDWSALPARTPAPVRDLLERCLAKDTFLRLRHLGDARLEIERALGRREWLTSARDRSDAGAGRPRAWAMRAGAVALVAAAVLLIRAWPAAAPPAAPYRFALPPPADASMVALGANIGGSAIAPDGRHLAFVAGRSDDSRLWIRALDSLAARPLDGTDGAYYPFWSPDSRHVAFFAGGRLKRVSLAGGMPAIVADAPLGRGGSWGPDGTILFTPNVGSRVHRVPAEGGAPVPITTPAANRRETSHSFPVWLPGHRFLYLARSNDPELSGLYVAHVDAPDDRHMLLASNFNAVYAPRPGGGGGLVYVHDGRLAVREYDATRAQLGERVTTLAEGVEYAGNIGLAHVSASASGAIVYGRSGTGGVRLRWVDRSGQVLQDVGAPDDYIGVQLSPDGRRAAVARVDPQPGTPDIWAIDLETAARTQVTFDARVDFHAVWAPDGQRLAYASMREGLANIFVQPATGAGPIDMLLPAGRFRQPLDWSPDGRFVVFQERNEIDGDEDLWAVRLDEARAVVRLTKGPEEESHAQVSPDGRLLAYRHDEGTRGEIVVQAFPGGGGRWQISTGGGSQPRWRADGRELYYLTPDGAIAAVEVRRSGGSLMVGPPRRLFDARTISSARYEFTFDAAPAGDRFLVLMRDEGRGAERMAVLLNWHALAPAEAR